MVTALSTSFIASKPWANSPMILNMRQASSVIASITYCFSPLSMRNRTFRPGSHLQAGDSHPVSAVVRSSVREVRDPAVILQVAADRVAQRAGTFAMQDADGTDLERVRLVQEVFELFQSFFDPLAADVQLFAEGGAAHRM